MKGRSGLAPRLRHREPGERRPAGGAGPALQQRGARVHLNGARSRTHHPARGQTRATSTARWNLVVDGALDPTEPLGAGGCGPGQQFAEGNESDNVFPAIGTPLASTSAATDPFNVRFIPVITKADNRQGNVTAANRDQLPGSHDAHASARELRRRRCTRRTPPRPTDRSSPTTGTRRGTPSCSEILTRQMAEGGTRYYYGVVNPAYSSGVAGVGYIGAPAAIGWDKLPSGSSVAAHEWGHNWDRQHAPCGGAGNPDDNYPYAGGEIGVVGLRSGGRAASSRPTSHDLMGYCDNEWISDYTYKACHGLPATESSVAGMAEAIQPALLVWGRIEGGRVVLEPAFRVTARPSLPRRPGPYRIEGRAADGGRHLRLRFRAARGRRRSDRGEALRVRGAASCRARAASRLAASGRTRRMRPRTAARLVRRRPCEVTRGAAGSPRAPVGRDQGADGHGSRSGHRRHTLVRPGRPSRGDHRRATSSRSRSPTGCGAETCACGRARGDSSRASPASWCVALPRPAHPGRRPSIRSRFLRVQAGATRSDSAVVTLERTPCFGTCPVYRGGHVSASGMVRFVGTHHVARQGEATAEIGPRAVDSLLRELEAGGLLRLCGRSM